LSERRTRRGGLVAMTDAAQVKLGFVVSVDSLSDVTIQHRVASG
jgi:hypothetical protein